MDERYAILVRLATEVCEAQRRWIADQTAHPAYAEDVDATIKAMDQWLTVDPYSLPVEQIPDGWGFDYLCRTREGWNCRIVIDNQSRSISGSGPDSRSALLRACEAARGM